ncbi:MAG TPA: PrgI family protein [Candidatus Saccharimonadales bacterium]|nr:PrgI family protein [Candidatus Saccharimonadales bacterium]
MAVYKVPQDVEADDKLIGPFSFRQFIYLIIVAISIAIGWGLSQLFLPLAVIPLPLVLFFGALALPLRKDQPMEIYLAAVVSYYLKPRRRLWQADGIQSLVEITAPKVVEIVRAKDLSQSEAERRLSYLADIVDTGGWSIRGVASAQIPSAMQNDVYFAAQQTEDILANDGGVSRSFDTMINQSDMRRRQEILDRLHQTEFTAVAPLPAPQYTAPSLADPYATMMTLPTQPPIPTQQPPVTLQTPAPNPTPGQTFDYNPYPNSMHQSVIKPLSEQPVITPPAAQPAVQPPAPQMQAPAPMPAPAQAPIQQQPQPSPPPPSPTTPPEPITTSEKVVSPDIMNLANNHDLSIETIAHEANRIHQQESSDDEVVISLR